MKIKERFKSFFAPKNKNKPFYAAVITAIIVMDSVFLYQFISSAKAQMQSEFVNAAENVDYVFRSSFDSATQIATSLCMNDELDEFLETEYTDERDYYDEYRSVIEKGHLVKMSSLNNTTMEIYANNETLINGGGVYRMSLIEDKDWFKEFEESGEDALLIFLYDKESRRPTLSARKLYYLRWMDYHPGSKYKKLCKIEINYKNLCTNIEKSLYDVCVYLCQGDRIVVSSEGGNNLMDDFPEVDYGNVNYRQDVSFYGNDFSIVVPKNINYSTGMIRKNTAYLSVFLILNLIMSIIFVKLGNMLQEGKIKEQEMDIARQNAELLALHSQNNPHFLFNALESIRMYSLLQGEDEIAEMIENLAIIERKNADWNEDETTVCDEMVFVEAYLMLQQYRFGNRLSYEIDVEEEYKNVRIPRLTIVTFVENACVHGIEGKSSPGWIFVSVKKSGEYMLIEVEDTGGGMSEEELSTLKDKMDNASLDKLKTKGRIGIVNACLRLKMFSDNSVRFEVDSEKGIGTTVSVYIPLTLLKDSMAESEDVVTDTHEDKGEE